MATIFQVLIALPKILGFIKDFILMIQKAQKDAAKRRHEEASKNLDEAKTEQEVIDAARDYMDRL